MPCLADSGPPYKGTTLMPCLADSGPPYKCNALMPCLAGSDPLYSTCPCAGWMYVVALAGVLMLYNIAAGVHQAARGGNRRRGKHSGGGGGGGGGGHGHSHGMHQHVRCCVPLCLLHTAIPLRCPLRTRVPPPPHPPSLSLSLSLSRSLPLALTRAYSCRTASFHAPIFCHHCNHGIDISFIRCITLHVRLRLVVHRLWLTASCVRVRECALSRVWFLLPICSRSWRCGTWRCICPRTCSGRQRLIKTHA